MGPSAVCTQDPLAVTSTSAPNKPSAQQDWSTHKLGVWQLPIPPCRQDMGHGGEGHRL